MEPGHGYKRDATTMAIAAPIDATDVPALCAQVRELLIATGSGVVFCDLGALTTADLATVNALARLHLTAVRCGGKIRLRDVSSELHELLALIGLCGVIGPCVEPTDVEADRTAGTPSPCPGRTSFP
jgi:ABC-type transporter Mla MlaB component